jgi:type II secretory pathway pseudopilin PulG
VNIKKSGKVVRASFLTLLEILIVLALIAGLGGIFAFQVKSWLAKQEASQEMEQALKYLRRAEELTLMANFDSEVVLEKGSLNGSKAWELKVSPKSSTPPHLGDLARFSTFEFKKVNQILFQPPGGSPIEQKSYPLSFISKGFFMPDGQLILKAGELSQGIVFLGYPSSLSLEPVLPALPDKQKLKEQIERIVDKIGLETRSSK